MMPSERFERQLPALLTELASRALPPMSATPVATAQLGPEAGMIGAATMALAGPDGEGVGWPDG